MSELDLTTMRVLAENVAHQASDWLASAGSVRDIAFKPDESIVTEADRAVERLIVDAIKQACPDHAIIGEESADRWTPRGGPDRGRYCWIIDPIDGTRNYAAGFPCFATAIALLRDGVPVVGVIREHCTGHTYSATTDGPTLLDGKTIRIPQRSACLDTIVAFPSSKDKMTVRVARQWLARPGLVPRNIGSTAMHLALVATGAVQATYAHRCKIWDIAAGALVVERAGGLATRLDGGPLFPWSQDADPNDNIPVLAGQPKRHGELLEDFWGED